jgi:hypothetical protein
VRKTPTDVRPQLIAFRENAQCEDDDGCNRAEDAETDQHGVTSDPVADGR